MKIAIFGGSFNPIHKGHTLVAKEAIEKLKLDKLIFVPTSKSPFKKKNIMVSGQDRINMIKKVLPEKCEISDFEVKRFGISYTIETVKYFKQKYPNDDIFILIGSDNISKLNKWRKIDEISKLAKFVVFKRSNNFSKINIKKYGAIILNNQVFDYSSTSFKKLEFDNVEETVMEYIGENLLYTSEILFNMMNGDKERHKHSIAASEAASIYAKLLGENSKKAWFAGLFHDITKTQKKEWHRDFLKKYGHHNLKDYQLHSLSAYYWIRDIYKCKDEKILHAIKIHTSLDFELSNMDKIVYAADKLCDGRSWEGIQQIRQKILVDFETGFIELVKKIFTHLIEKRGNLEDEQIQIYERILNDRNNSSR